LLAHLYVLIPVLDGDKHYYVGDEEVAKLMKHGGRVGQTHHQHAPATQHHHLRGERHRCARSDESLRSESEMVDLLAAHAVAL
jgi:hypothetical protein